MTRFIFIFPIILVYFLTIVSKNTFCVNNSLSNYPIKLRTFLGKDTIMPLFNDDFESGNLSGWKQTESWEVSPTEPISGSLSLKQVTTGVSGNSSVFHSIRADWNTSDLEWSFKLKNGKWDPSSSNKFWFYLSADTIKTELISGFAVGVNISGSTDLLSLWRNETEKLTA